jgi:ABC-type multidrug transport system fused ATPase/permease subunit
MEIQSNNTFAYEEYKFRKSLEEFGATGVDIARVYGKTTFASQFFSGLATLSALMVGGWIFIKNGGAAQNIGDLTAMITAIGTIINPLNSLIDFSQRYQESAIKFNMIRDYLNIPKEMEDKKNAKETAKTDNEIKMDNLSFGFDPQKKILKNINLDIKPGEHVALVGPAGCGKSTLSLLVNRMMKASLGELKLNDVNIVDVKLSSLRKTIGYVAQAKTNAPILYGGTLIDNIVYPLKRKDKNSSGEEKEWLELESIGIKNLEELQNEILEIIKDVALYEDVYNFGLCNMTLLEALTYKDSLFKIKDPEAIRTEILKGRKKLKEKMTGEYKDLIEFFDEEKFMNYSNIMENIIFTSAEPFLKDAKSYEILKKVLLPVCKEGEIYETIFEIGCKTALELGDICKKVKSDDSQLIRKLGIPQQAMRQFVMISEKIKSEGKEKINKVLPPPAIDQIYRLGFEYSLSHGMDIPVDDALKSRILKARKLFKERLTPELKDKITFYEKDNYIDGATIRDNLIMGKINTVVNGAEERISSLLKEVITEVSLEDEIITLGLLMDIGERGAKLSGGQAQKTAITRVLLKKPSILILDEATSALDNASQQKINDMLLKRFKDKTVITIAHRLDTIKDYDRIVVLKAGEIIETGSFDELLEKKGLFFELWETLFAQRR